MKQAQTLSRIRRCRRCRRDHTHPRLVVPALRSREKSFLKTFKPSRFNMDQPHPRRWRQRRLRSSVQHPVMSARVTLSMAQTSVSVLPLTRRSQICRSRSASPSKAERSFMAARIFRPRIIDGEACEARARAGVSRQREQLERGPVDSGVIEDLIEAGKLSGPRSRKQSLGSCSSEARHSLSPLAGRGALGLVPRRHWWSVAPARLAGWPARILTLAFAMLSNRWRPFLRDDPR
jgi:hypothetical protein